MTKVLIHGRDNRIGGADPIPPGEWVYVGDYPGDADTIPTSPPFQNSWVNAGGGARRLRFRRTNENQTEIAGSVTGGTIGTVVTTLPALYRVTEVEYAVGANDGVILVWKLDTNGELTVLASINFGGGGSTPVNALHWGVNTDTDSVGLTLTTDDNIGVNVSGDGISTGFIDIFSEGTGVRITPTLIDNELDTGGIFQVADSSANQLLKILENGSIELDAATSGQNIDLNAFDIRMEVDEDVEAFGQTFGAFMDDTATLSAGALSIVADTTTTPDRIGMFLGTGAEFVIFDSIGNPLLKITDGSNDIHIQTGANIVADL